MVDFVPLDTIAPATVEALLDDAFGADRHGRTAYRMREGVAAIAPLSFAAVDGGALMGCIQCWPVALATDDGAHHAMTLVGPVAVTPTLQRGGIGRALMTECLKIADAGPWDALVMIGDPEYYGRFFGFSADATTGWHVPGPVERHRLLARVRRASGLPADGRIVPDPAFALAPTSA